MTWIWPSTVMALRSALSRARFPLAITKRDESERLQDELVRQLDDYLLPRLTEASAPILVCLSGSTGAGKSTLVNSLIGERVSEVGILRPTTKEVVVVHHPGDAQWWQKRLAAIIPSVPPGTRAPNIRLVARAACPPGLAIADTPDLDSVSVENAQVATQLMAAADAWIFTTTASRYADAIPWDYLTEARARKLPLAVVLNRVPSSGLGEVASHLGRMMAGQQLAQVPVFEIAQVPGLSGGLLPEAAVAGLRGWLRSQELRSSQVITSTLRGTLFAILEKTEHLAALADAQNVAYRELELAIDRAGTAALQGFADQLGDGSLLRGEALDCWQEFTDSAVFYRTVEPEQASWKDRIGSWFPVWGLRDLEEVLAETLTAVLVERVESLRTQIVDQWRSSEAGREVCLAAHADLEVAAPELAERISDRVDEWWAGLVQDCELGLAKSRAANRIGARGIAAALAVLVLAPGDGPGQRRGGGPGLLAARLVEASFGETETMANRAGLALGAMIRGAITDEQGRFRASLAQANVDLSLGDRLRAVVAEVDR